MTSFMRFRTMHDFTILILPQAYASSVAVTLDVLRAAETLAPRFKITAPRWRIVSPDGGSVSLSSGMSVETMGMPGSRRDHSLWIVPGLGVDSAAGIAKRLACDDAQRAINAIRRHAMHGGSIAASCTGVFLLQAAGLLCRRRVTTSWWLSAELQRLEPGCVVDSGRMICHDGSLLTAGAAMAQTDLMLHLLRLHFDTSLADTVACVLLLDARQAQSPYNVPMMLATGVDLVARLADRIDSAFPDLPSVENLAREFAMSTRTLSRHVHAATGGGTLALIQAVRLNRARTLIQTSRMTIEEVARQVGYEDATALRRLMQKMTGGNPSRFRST